MDPADLAFVVLDFETTGLSPRYAEVIETGAVHVTGGRARRTFHALSRPARGIPPAATALHGIAADMVDECPPFEAVLPLLREFLGDRVIVAHHARFDLSFLEAALRRAGKDRPDQDVWCTARLSRRLFPELPRHDLDSLCVSHGIRRGAAHRALDDALATADLLGILLERAAEVGAGVPELEAVARPPRRSVPARPRTWSEEEKHALEDAIVTGDRLVLDYVSRRGMRTSRIVVPYALGGTDGAPLLLGYDLAVGRTRTFRLDRVVSLRSAG